MATLKILEFPDPRLRTKAQPVAVIDDSIRQLVKDLFETMYAAEGIGLAATQVNVHKRLLVLDVGGENPEPMVLINPEIKAISGEHIYEEGCLSVPGFAEEVTRPEVIEVKARDENDLPLVFKCDGLLATCIQHEVDHLNGKLFVDYISSIKRSRISDKLKKLKKQRT